MRRNGRQPWPFSAAAVADAMAVVAIKIMTACFILVGPFRVRSGIGFLPMRGAKIDARSEASTVAQKQPSERFGIERAMGAVEIWAHQRASNAGTIVGRL